MRNRAAIGYIHRRTGAEDIYFVNNREPAAVRLSAEFRVSGKGVELWDAVSGGRHVGCGGSWLGNHEGGARPAALRIGVRGLPRTTGHCCQPPRRNHASLRRSAGPWSVSFDPKWGGPPRPWSFANLADWSAHPEPGIRFYSGTAVYQKNWTWDGNAGETGLLLDLGEVRELAEVKLNGRSLGIVWSPPFRVAIPAGPCARATTNSKSRSSISGRTASSATPACPSRNASPAPTSASSPPAPS